MPTISVYLFFVGEAVWAFLLAVEFFLPTTTTGAFFESTVPVRLSVLAFGLNELNAILSFNSNSFCCFLALSPIEKNDGTAAARAITATNAKKRTGKPLNV